MTQVEMFDAATAAIDALDKARQAEDYNYFRQHMNEARERMEALKAALHMAIKDK